jgi:hypothetical protein
MLNNVERELCWYSSPTTGDGSAASLRDKKKLKDTKERKCRTSTHIRTPTPSEFLGQE